jgi:Tol biopolymer transport system component/predicted Ser/Thr protein kinase
MPLSDGTKLGSYEILAPIGVGGMGEVYKANDTRLNRVVAIKVSKENFSERFDREARSIAALNHPNICQLYDVGPNYLVMEFIEGAPLKGPVPIEKAIEYAAQILDALDAAHRKSITHRDLKPGNILVTKQGIKLIDFRLAKQHSTPLKESDATLTQASTNGGQILGTLQYMSPEQLQGKPVDARSDLFSFGCVLYEMLTGKRAFEGQSAASVIAAILEREPAPLMTALPLERVLKRCRAKDPDQRFQTACDLKAALGWTLEQPPVAAEKRTIKLPWAIAAGAVLALVVLGAILWRATATVEHPLQPIMHRDVDLGSEVALGAAEGSPFAMSPDDTRLVFLTHGSDNKDHLALRLLGSPTTIALAGTEGAGGPFFSPDSRWIGFFADRKLKKISVEAGAPVTLCEARNPRGGAWAPDGSILFAPEARAGLMRVSSSGGIPQPATQLDAGKGEETHRFPQFLHGGNAFLFLTRTADVGYEDSTILVQSTKTGQRKTLFKGAYGAHYLPTSPNSGHLVYMHDGTLFAAPVDPKRLELTGPASPVIEDVSGNSGNAYGRFDFTPSGTFVYLAAATNLTLSLMQEDGTLQPLLLPAQRYLSARASPDGASVLLASTPDQESTMISLYEIASHRLSRITTLKGAPANWVLAFAPDGKHFVFTTDIDQLAGPGLYWMRSDGSEPQRLVEGRGLVPGSVSPDGKRVAYWGLTPPYGIWTVPLDVTDPDHPRAGTPDPLLPPTFGLRFPAFSPDGRWIAYSSFDSGRFQIYVRRFPGPGAKIQVSLQESRVPLWSRSSSQISFTSVDGRIWIVDYTAKGDSFVAGEPRLWFPKASVYPLRLDVMPDGKRFLVGTRSGGRDVKAGTHLTFLMNFFDELRRRVR